MKTVKKVKLKLHEIVVRFFVFIWNRVKYYISEYLKNFLIGAVAIGLLLAFFTYTTVVDGLTLEEQILRINKTLLVFSLPILSVILVYGFISFILKYRKWSLLGSGVLGLVLATNVLILINNSGSDSCTALYEIVTFIKGHQVLVSSITILALGLPTFFTLWLFRTHDTQENINNSTFVECTRILMAEDSAKYTEENRIKDSLPKKIALEQLAHLRLETGFDKKKIDILTKGLFLNDKEFSYAQLRGINLSSAKLIETSLAYADLRDAILSSTDLKKANLGSAVLKKANLTNADLEEADLGDAALKEANLRGLMKGTDLSNDVSELIRGADLSNAVLVWTNLSNANLKGTNLSNVVLGTTTFIGARYDKRTNFKGTIFENDKGAREAAGMIDDDDPKNKPGLGV